jgi:flagellar biosynthetic protein FliQ
VGVAISILQAVTQIQEMTLTFVPKIVAVALALLIFLPWIIQRLVSFTLQLYGQIPTLAG